MKVHHQKVRAFSNKKTSPENKPNEYFGSGKEIKLARTESSEHLAGVCRVEKSVYDLINAKETKLVLFDFDNTIANTTLQHYEAWCLTCSNYKLDFFSFEDYYTKYCGYNAIKTLQKLSEKNKLNLSNDQIKEIASARSVEFAKKFKEIKPFPELVDVIKHCEKRKLPMVIVSGSSPDEILEILFNGNFEEIKKYFNKDNIVGQGMYARSKPYPDSYYTGKQAMEKLKNDGKPFSNRECLVIGDAYSDIYSAWGNSINTQYMQGQLVENKILVKLELQKYADIMQTFNVHSIFDKNKQFVKDLYEKGREIEEKYKMKST